MKKLITVLCIVALAFSIFGCSGASKKYEIALITDKGTIDDKSFNQGAWEGVKKYAEENKVSYKYYQPVEASMNAYLDAIKLAVDGGAKIIVTPGFLFENPVHKAQTLYPEVKFVILDGSPHNVTDFVTMATYDSAAPDFTIKNNVYSIFYKEEQAGFLAGYAAVKDGNTKLGFMGGMAVPAVVRFGYGFVQGAEYAAKEMGIASIEMKYHYTGDFKATPEVQAMAASWFASGTQVIFGCGGAVGNSVMAAAEVNNNKVIGVDVDQSNESATVITSAMKDLTGSVYSALKSFYADKFPGGKSEKLGVEVSGVALPMATSKFTAFKQADYDKIFAALKADTNGIATGIKTDAFTNDVTKLPVTIVKVSFVE